MIIIISYFTSNLMIQWKKNNKEISYNKAISFMNRQVQGIIDQEKSEMIWFLEHPPIYTRGTSASDEELLSPIFPVYETGRGGKYTYHGPGQQVIYTMLDLKKFFDPHKPDIKKFVLFLENWIILTLADYGLKAFTIPGNIGIWVEENSKYKKIAAIGIKIKKWVSFHGIAININPNIAHFDGIIPCGIKEFGVTSLAKFGIFPKAKEFDKALKKSFYKSYKNFKDNELHL